ncbi:BlaI/MecI/CopY family transcriptional regulator [Edaphobacter sp. 12200R-103]|jgi:predicted transcriptional regulator|uniref:BlaI/MecI/CopY family transcriptional regulator n=1 Tax=Edaphobacter sp. 12200R-103 TaxID=2703788 RepID=UPI00138DA5B5|nr:BlaI/MecI/CopY family transcriptional regulator [Edaphobacter sp. 12200R-103]QHS52703.1 BlaI/MecI/CopY family transcriptional regulator [Edaphobacter sp. 12200R-103]
MGHKEKDGLTRLELKIMQVVWRRGPSNVTEVQEDLDEPLAYTTVQTMLNILERKRKVKRKLRGRAYEYSAAVSESKAVSHAVRDLVDRMFGGSSEELVMSLIKSRQLDRETIARLTKRLEEGDGE